MVHHRLEDIGLARRLRWRTVVTEPRGTGAGAGYWHVVTSRHPARAWSQHRPEVVGGRIELDGRDLVERKPDRLHFPLHARRVVCLIDVDNGAAGHVCVAMHESRVLVGEDVRHVFPELLWGDARGVMDD